MLKFNPIYLILFCTLCVSCQKKDLSPGGPPDPPDTTSPPAKTYARHFTKYKNETTDSNVIGLQMIYDDTVKSRKLAFWGNFNADGSPKELYFFQIVKDNNDTIFNYNLNDTLGLSAVSMSLKNQPVPLPAIFKVSRTNAGISYAGLYYRYWSTERDSVLKEVYYCGDQIVYTAPKIQDVNNRVFYTKNSVAGYNWERMKKNLSAIKITLGPALDEIMKSASSSTLLWIYAGIASGCSALETMDVLAVAPLLEISYDNGPTAFKNAIGGDALSKYNGILDGSYVPPVVLYNPRLAPDELTMNIVCDFIAPITNYRNGSFFHEIDPERQQSDTAAFFFTKSDGTSFGTIHRQQTQNVRIDNNNIVTGQVFISNVWPLEKNWTMDSVRFYYSKVYFYSAFKYVGSGWGNISNVVHLQGN